MPRLREVNNALDNALKNINRKIAAAARHAGGKYSTTYKQLEKSLTSISSASGAPITFKRIDGENVPQISRQASYFTSLDAPIQAAVTILAQKGSMAPGIKAEAQEAGFTSLKKFAYNLGIKQNNWASQSNSIGSLSEILKRYFPFDLVGEFAEIIANGKYEEQAAENIRKEVHSLITKMGEELDDLKTELNLRKMQGQDVTDLQKEVAIREKDYNEAKLAFGSYLSEHRKRMIDYEN